MAGVDRAVWLRVAHGVESLSDRGAQVWSEPAQTRKALGELLGVFRATHVQIDLAALLDAGVTPADWPALLGRSGPWGALLQELALAVGSAIHAPVVWGLGLPNPTEVAAVLGDVSERGVLKAGMQLASLLQAFREAGIGFIAVDAGDTPAAGEPRALAPILRNSELYGWRRALCVPTLAALSAPRSGAEVTLVRAASITELRPLWARGDAVGGGLSGGFWSGEPLTPAAPPRCVLFGEVPQGTAPRALVDAGRTLRSWLG